MVFTSLLPGQFGFGKTLSVKGRPCSEEKNVLDVSALGARFPYPLPSGDCSLISQGTWLSSWGRTGNSARASLILRPSGVNSPNWSTLSLQQSITYRSSFPTLALVPAVVSVSVSSGHLCVPVCDSNLGGKSLS